jgi:hypothetical protein
MIRNIFNFTNERELSFAKHLSTKRAILKEEPDKKNINLNNIKLKTTEEIT